MKILMETLTWLLQNLPMIILLITTIIGIVNNIKAKKKLNDADMLKSINDLVSQAESLYHAGNGSSKLQYVKDELIKKYPNIDVNQLNDLIEAAVKVFNEYVINGTITNNTATTDQPNILQQVINTPVTDTPQTNINSSQVQ